MEKSSSMSTKSISQQANSLISSIHAMSVSPSKISWYVKFTIAWLPDAITNSTPIVNLSLRPKQ